MKLLLALALAAVFALPAAADDKFTLDGDNTKIKWVGTKKDGKHEGGFDKVTGTATAAGTDVTKLKIELEIDTTSITSDAAGLTKHLKGPDFFNTSEYPKASFKVTKIEKTDKGYDQTGDLTILGKAKEITFPSTITLSGDNLQIKSEFKIKRSEWGMTYGKGKVDDEVALTVEIKAKK